MNKEQESELQHIIEYQLADRVVENLQLSNSFPSVSMLAGMRIRAKKAYKIRKARKLTREMELILAPLPDLLTHISNAVGYNLIELFGIEKTNCGTERIWASLARELGVGIEQFSISVRLWFATQYHRSPRAPVPLRLVASKGEASLDLTRDTDMRRLFAWLDEIESKYDDRILEKLDRCLRGNG